jgi:hypothetical protein
MMRSGLAFERHAGPDGRIFNSGDVVIVTVDVDKGTVAFARDGTFLGVVFRNIPSGTVLRPFVRCNSDATVEIRPHPTRVEYVVNPHNIIVNNIAVLLRSWISSSSILQALHSLARNANLPGPLLKVLGLACENGTLLLVEGDSVQRVSLQHVDKAALYVTMEDTGETRAVCAESLKPAPPRRAESRRRGPWPTLGVLERCARDAGDVQPFDSGEAAAGVSAAGRTPRRRGSGARGVRGAVRRLPHATQCDHREA